MGAVVSAGDGAGAEVTVIDDLANQPPPPPAADARARSTGLLFTAAMLVLVAVPVVAAFISAATHPGLPKGDFAIIEMRALDVPGNLPLTGMYSRYGFNHPGPLLFYAIALPLRLFGPVGLQLTAGVVNLAAVVGLLVTLYRRGGQLLTVIGAVLVLLLIRAMQIEIVSVWNPWVPILPLALAIALTWSVWSRDWWALPWLALVVTFIVQSHVGFAATGAFLLGSSAVWTVIEVVRTRRRHDPMHAHAEPQRDDAVSAGPGAEETVTEETVTVDPGPEEASGPAAAPERIGAALAVAAGVLVVLWLPPLIDQIIHHPGNVTAILDFVRSGQPGEHKVGAGTGLEIVSQVVGINGTLFRGINRFALLPLAGSSVWSLLAVLLPFLAATGVAVWRRAYDAVRLAVIVAALVLIAWLSMAQITGPPYPYIAEWLVVVAAFLWLSTIWSVVSAVWPSASSLAIVPRHRERGRALVPLAVDALVLVVLAGVATAETVRDPGDGYQGDNVVEHFARSRGRRSVRSGARPRHVSAHRTDQRGVGARDLGDRDRTPDRAPATRGGRDHGQRP